MMAKAEFWLRLLMVTGLNWQRLINTPDYCSELHQQVSEALADLQLTMEQRARFYSADPSILKTTLRWLEQHGHQLLLCWEPNYPANLAEIAAFPKALFVQGNPDTLHRPQIAIVGSRENSHYGEYWTDYFARELAALGLVITSGLALGIDSIAHRGALAAEGTTVAVLGSGLLHIYPKRHQKLADDIVTQGGALVSEFFPATPPLANHFPRRNRIISGLSQAVLVAEATLRSGSLITARYALEQGRDIFALPGHLSSDNSEGCHWLIQQGAYLVTTVQDLLQQLNSSLRWVTIAATMNTDKSRATSGIKQQLPFADVFSNVDDTVTSIDAIATGVDISIDELLAQLMELELAGWILAVPGGYVRNIKPPCQTTKTSDRKQEEKQRMKKGNV